MTHIVPYMETFGWSLESQKKGNRSLQGDCVFFPTCYARWCKRPIKAVNDVKPRDITLRFARHPNLPHSDLLDELEAEYPFGVLLYERDRIEVQTPDNIENFGGVCFLVFFLLLLYSLVQLFTWGVTGEFWLISFTGVMVLLGISAVAGLLGFGAWDYDNEERKRYRRDYFAEEEFFENHDRRYRELLEKRDCITRELDVLNRDV